ncbi:cytochrome c [Rapidithrix thailandica]|uniref:Cytochrome c n=1 Tax=Rapidithrix thailandica TaxID=413964 RepID=A0AAW9S9C9_9BACT
MYTELFVTHKITVQLFLLIYLIKSVLLLINKQAALEKITKVIKVPEMIISFLFLATGIGMLFQVPEVPVLLMAKFAVVAMAIPVAIIGFKKQNKGLALLSFIMIVGAYGMAEINKKKKTKRVEIAGEVATDPANASYNLQAHGKVVYSSYCTTCHGEGGDLGAAGAKNLKESQLNTEEILQIIVNGKNAMPAYKALEEQEVKAVTSYVESLKN